MNQQRATESKRRRLFARNIETLESRTLLSGLSFDVTTSADSGPGSLRQAILDADSQGGQQPLSLVFTLPTTDPGYNPSSNSWTLQLDSSLPILTDVGVSIDASEGSIILPGSITIQGSATPSDILSILGYSQETGVDEPDPATTGSGAITLGSLAIDYSGMTSVTVSNLAGLTFETPNAGNNLIVSSPATNQNEISGTSGSLNLAPLTFFNIAGLTIDTADNDTGATSGDAVLINSSGLVASGLSNLTVETGPANNTLTDLATSLALPVAGGTFLDEGGSGDNTVVAQADANYSLSSSALTIPGSGSLTLQQVQDVQLTGGPDSNAITVNGWLGDLGLNGGSGSDQLTVNEPGSYSGNLSLANFTSTSIDIQGDFFGTISAPQTSTIQQILIAGNDEPGSSITAGAFVPSSGTTTPAVQVNGNFGGYILASENLAIPGSGVLNSITIGGNLLPSSGSLAFGTPGLIASGAIGTLSIGQDLDGTVYAAGAGTIVSINVGGNLNGNILAPEDSNPGSGIIGTVIINGSASGTISSGTIQGIQVGKALTAFIIAEGAGVIGNVTVGGNLSGEVIAQLDPNSSTSAEISSITVGGALTGTISAVRQIGTGSVASIGSTGSIDAGNILSSLTVNSNSGSIEAGNVGSFVGSQAIGGSVQLASVNSFTIGTLTGQVNLGSAGTVAYLSMAAGSEINASSIKSLTITNDLGGIVDVSGDLNQLTVSGSMLAGSKILANTLESVSIGQNMAGVIDVTAGLCNMKVGGATSGSIIAGSLGTLSAGAATGPVVLQVQIAGVERQLQTPTASNPFPQPGQVPTGSLAQTTFRYFLSSGSLANPNLTVQVDNASGNKSPDQFDLSLVVDSASSRFNLARLDALGVSGIGNVTVEGNILTSVVSTAQAFFPGDSNKPGVQLPLDKLEGVGVRDLIPLGSYINAYSIEGVAAGSVGLNGTSTVLGVNASAYEVQSLLSSTTRIVQASGTFRVPFDGNRADQVGFFMDDDTWGQFDWADVSFTIESQLSVNTSGTANVVTPSNVARGSDVALIQVGIPTSGGNSVIQGITILGDGASIQTYQWIDGPIVSTGPLGDLFLLSSQPVGNITAPSIFGTILSYAQFDGTIQTTGLWTNPISGAVSCIPGTFGESSLNSSGQITTNTFETYSGALTGNLIVRGNLLANIVLNGGLTGSIDALDNIGSTTPSNARLGGITINGNDSGTIAAMGQILGNLTINGTLGKTGSIASFGGIVGSTTLNGGMQAGSRIISGGAIGSSAFGTELTVYGGTNGLIVSAGSLIEWSGDANSPTTFAGVGSTALMNVIDEIFAGSTASTSPLTNFDLNPFALDLIGLSDILGELALLHLNKAGQFSLIPNT